MFKHVLASALLSALTFTAAQAEPVALALPQGVTLAPYLGGTPVGIGAIDDSDTLFFVREQRHDNVQSWLLHYDPQGVRALSATVDFGQTILGVLESSTALLASQANWGIDIDGNGVFDDYGAARLMGLEDEDQVQWIAGGSMLTLQWRSADPGDMVRVFTAVPEPATLALAGLALAAAGLARRRR
jgi:hypothetical protein